MMKNKRSSPVDKWTILSILGLVIILSGAGYYYATVQSGSEEQVIETSTIDSGDIILSATGIGTLIPQEEVSFGFRDNGQVSEVLVSLGEEVKAGQVLARLENTTLGLQYKQAEANLAALESPSGIAAAKQAVEDAKQSLVTAADDLQYMIGPEMFVAEELVADAQAELEATRAVVDKDPSDTNKQRVSAAEAALAQAQQTLSYAYYNYSDSYTKRTFTFPIRNSGGVTIRRELIAPTEAEIDAAHAAYDLAKANLSDAENYLDVLLGSKSADVVPASSVTSLMEAKLALDSAEAGLRGTELISPISGNVTSLDLNVGENVGTSAVITISNMDQPYSVEALLDETDWDKAKVGNAATVTFDLLPDETYSGKVIKVYPVLDDSTDTSMVHILVQLDDSIHVDLPVGSTASVDVTGGEALGVILVPISALKELESGKYVVYLMKDGKPVEQEVEIGLQDILYAEVISGLKTGDVVINGWGSG